MSSFYHRARKIYGINVLSIVVLDADYVRKKTYAGVLKIRPTLFTLKQVPVHSHYIVMLYLHLHYNKASFFPDYYVTILHHHCSILWYSLRFSDI